MQSLSSSAPPPSSGGMVDLNNSEESITARIKAYKTYREVSGAETKLRKTNGDSLSKSTAQLATQLDKIKDLQKRYLKDPPNSTDKLLDFLGETRGNGSETTFNIECEDYLSPFTGAGIPSGRVYANNIYVIKDFVVKFRNKSTSSALGLLSSRTYLQNPDVYNTGAPQTFWVSDQDELITSDISGQTRTQLNNQYIWTVNYDSVLDTSVTKLTENIGNLFTTDSSSDTPPTNSLTNILSSTEYNLGYNETSILSFIGSNKSLLDPSKWIDTLVTASSTSKLLTSIHPVVPNLETIVETNSDKVKTINAGDDNSTIIPINIYFKINSLDSNQNGINYKYINLNSSTKTVKHVKKIKFFLENEAENRPFTFSIKFNINRSKVIMASTKNYTMKTQR